MLPRLSRCAPPNHVSENRAPWIRRGQETSVAAISRPRGYDVGTAELSSNSLGTTDIHPGVVCQGARQRQNWPRPLFRKMDGLLRLAASTDLLQFAAASHSENWYDFSGREDGPVKGIAFRESHAHMTTMTRNRRCCFQSRADWHCPHDRGRVRRTYQAALWPRYDGPGKARTDPPGHGVRPCGMVVTADGSPLWAQSGFGPGLSQLGASSRGRSCRLKTRLPNRLRVVQIAT